MIYLKTTSFRQGLDLFQHDLNHCARSAVYKNLKNRLLQRKLYKTNIIYTFTLK